MTTSLFARDKKSALSPAADRILHSPLFILFLVCACAVPYAFSAYAAGFWLCCAALSLALVLTRSILPSFAAFLFCTVSVIEQYKITYEEIFGYAGVLALVIPALVFHIFYYAKGRRGYTLTRMFFPQLAVSVALLLGGAGTITAAEYFSLPSIYYMLFLGIVLLAIMVFCDCDMPFNFDFVGRYLARTLMGIALLFCIMWIIAFVHDGTGQFPYRQWKNNAGNFMLIAMPLTVWRGSKSRFGVPYVLFALVQVSTVILSGSRGATLAIAVTLILSAAVYVYGIKDKKARLAAEGALALALLITLAAIFLSDGASRLISLFESMDIFDGNGREELYFLGVQNALDYPLFGVGIGYINEEAWQLNDMAIFWYHSTPVQVAASMGAAGGAAYLYQFIARIRLGLRRNTYCLSVLISFLGFAAYSCINTGDFTPLPFGVLMVVLFLSLERDLDLPASKLFSGRRMDFVRGK